MSQASTDRRVPRRFWAHLAIGLVAVVGAVATGRAGRGWWQEGLPPEVSWRMTAYFAAAVAFLAVSALLELSLAWRLARYRGAALLAPRLWPWPPLLALVGPVWVLLRGPQSRLMLAGFAEQPVWIVLVALSAWAVRYGSQRADRAGELPPAVKQLLPSAARPLIAAELLAACALLLAVAGLELLPLESFFAVRPPRG